MSKKRLYELAKELGLSSKELISKAKEANIIVNNHMSNIESHEEKIIRDMFAKKNDIKSGSKENTINSPDSVKMKETVKNNVRDTIN
ncbi:MAG: translation initiation factor IF-2 N-terminal domain-containing protein, partial [Lutispora sp.]